MERRFPVLLMFLCILACGVVLLRRRQIPGAALRPSRRLVLSAILSVALLALTPTKWTHHFGAFAAIGSSLAALTALATSASVLRSRRNRALFAGGLCMVTALTLTGANAWWYVSDWGSPWFDKSPSFDGFRLRTIALILAGIAFIVAAIEHFRTTGSRKRTTPVPSFRARTRLIRLASIPLTVTCVVLVLAELVSTGKAISQEWNTYSLGKDNVAQLLGNSCGLSDYVQVEPNPVHDVLTSTSPQPNDANSQATMDGFQLNGYPTASAQQVGTPPFGLASAPVWGNYSATSSETASELRTPWYTLPDSARTGQSPLVVDIAGTDKGSASITAEFGKQTTSGFQVVASQQLTNETNAPGWREVPLMLSGAATQANEVQLVVNAHGTSPSSWVALTSPRVPTLINLTSFIGNAPTYLEWTAGLQYPCLPPFSLHDGIAQLPQYRITADGADTPGPGGDLRSIGEGWASSEGGGPLGWLDVAASSQTIPTYLKGDITRDWGTLYEVKPYVLSAPPSTALHVSYETHWGWYSPGPVSKPIVLPGDPGNPPAR